MLRADWASTIGSGWMVVALVAGCRADASRPAGGASGQGGSPSPRDAASGSGEASGAGARGAAPSPDSHELVLSGTVTAAGGAPIAGASVSLAANPAVGVSTSAAGTFSLVSEFPMGKPLPPRWPVSRPVEHTIVVESPGYLAAYRGVSGALATDESIVMLTAVSAGTASAAPALEPTVAEYRGDKLAAVTMTFDDTHLSQLTVARPLFDQYGFNATFYVNSAGIGPDQFTTWAMWKDAADGGFEIGNHGRSHWIKPECTPENDAFNWDEMRGGFEDVAAAIGRPPLTFAFPGGGYSLCSEALVVPAGHVDYRRDNHLAQADRLYPEGDTLTIETGVAAIETVIAHTPSWNGAILSWLLFYMHDVTPERAAVLEAMLDFIAEHDAEVWCTGYGEATVYQREREQSTLEVLGRGARSLTFRLSNSLDAATFSEPLTVVMPIPVDAGEIHATAYRDAAGGPIEVRVRTAAIEVDVVPGDAPVHVRY